MDAGTTSARQVRAQHRYELRTLTYVTLDQANGGIVRNLTHNGIGMQVVAAVRPRQQMRVRFELRYPRLRVEARGEVVWATFSGQCGIRFLDMPAVLRRQINEWIFADLLEGISLHDPARSIFAGALAHPTGNGGSNGGGNGKKKSIVPAEQDDGLMISAAPLKVIELPVRPEPLIEARQPAVMHRDATELDWLSQPLSGRGLAWTVNTLMVVAALFLFALVFLAVTRQAPQWPFAMAGTAGVLVATLYWGFFRIFGGGSFGARLARMADGDSESDAEESRFR